MYCKSPTYANRTNYTSILIIGAENATGAGAELLPILGENRNVTNLYRNREIRIAKEPLCLNTDNLWPGNHNQEVTASTPDFYTGHQFLGIRLSKLKRLTRDNQRIEDRVLLINAARGASTLRFPSQPQNQWIKVSDVIDSSTLWGCMCQMAAYSDNKAPDLIILQGFEVCVNRWLGPYGARAFFERDLAEFIADIRKHFGKNVPVLMTQLGTTTEGVIEDPISIAYSFWELGYKQSLCCGLGREVLVNSEITLPPVINNCYIVPTFDCPLGSSMWFNRAGRDIIMNRLLHEIDRVGLLLDQAAGGLGFMAPIGAYSAGDTETWVQFPAAIAPPHPDLKTSGFLRVMDDTQEESFEITELYRAQAILPNDSLVIFHESVAAHRYIHYGRQKMPSLHLQYPYILLADSPNYLPVLKFNAYVQYS